MALVKCHECGKDVSTEAAACPNCGAGIKRPAAKVSGWHVVGLVVAGLLFVFFTAGNDAPPATAKPQVSDADCKKDLQCWGDKGLVAAGVYCAERVEKLAAHSVRWTDGTFETKFSRFRWKNKDQAIITFIGDKAEFQNGFGAYTPIIYECDLNQATKTVLDVRASEGRLP